MPDPGGHPQGARARSPPPPISPFEALKEFSLQLLGIKFGSGALWEGSD